MTRLKGQPHPAEDGHSEDTLASPYAPYAVDPFPRRPREVICELLHFHVPLQGNTHNNLGEYYLLDKVFMKTTKVLVHHARQGHMADHLSTAKQLEVVSTGGNITALELYRWGKECRSSAYMSQVAQRRKLAKLGYNATTTYSAEEQATLQTVYQLESLYEAERSQMKAHFEPKITAARQALEAAQVKGAQRMAEFDARWSPFTKLPALSKSEILDACYAKALTDGSIQQATNKTEVLSSSLLDQYSAVVLQEHVMRYYQNPENWKGLKRVGNDHLATLEQEGGLHAAKRLKALIAACDS